MPARKTTAANLAATAASKLAAASEAAKAVPTPEVPTVLDGVVDKAGTNGKAAPKPKPAKAAPKTGETSPDSAPAPKPAKAAAEWYDVANKPPTANEIARYEWTLKVAKLSKTDLPLNLFVLSARAQGPFQREHRS